MAHSRPITNEIEIRFNPVVVPSNNVLFLTLLKGQQLSGWIWFRIFFRTTFRLVQWRSVTYGHRSYVWIPLGIGANCLLIKTSTDEEAGPFRFTFRVVLGPFPALLLSIQFISVCRHVFSPLLFSFLSFFFFCARSLGGPAHLYSLSPTRFSRPINSGQQRSRPLLTRFSVLLSCRLYDRSGLLSFFLHVHRLGRSFQTGPIRPEICVSFMDCLFTCGTPLFHFDNMFFRSIVESIRLPSLQVRRSVRWGLPSFATRFHRVLLSFPSSGGNDGTDGLIGGRVFYDRPSRVVKSRPSR